MRKLLANPLVRRIGGAILTLVGVAIAVFINTYSLFQIV